MEEHDDGSFHAVPPERVTGQPEVERDWATKEPLEVDSATGEVLNPEPTDDAPEPEVEPEPAPAKLENGERYEFIMDKLTDPDFVIKRVNDRVDRDTLAKIIGVISEHQGVPVPTDQYIEQQLDKDNDELKTELQQLALGADA